MPDWNRIVREHLKGLKFEGATEAEIIDEMAQHIEDRYRELLASGTSEGEAERLAVEPLNDGPLLVEAVRRARTRPASEPPTRPAGDVGILRHSGISADYCEQETAAGQGAGRYGLDSRR